MGEISKVIAPQYSHRNACNYMNFVSQIEAKKIDEAVIKENWSLTMQEWLNKFERNNNWELVPKSS